MGFLELGSLIEGVGILVRQLCYFDGGGTDLAGLHVDLVCLGP